MGYLCELSGVTYLLLVTYYLLFVTYYLLHTWLWVVHMRAIWDIGVKYRGWQAPYTDHCARPPTKYITQSPPKIHLTKYQMVSNIQSIVDWRFFCVFKGKLAPKGFVFWWVVQWKNETYLVIISRLSDLRLTSPQWPWRADWWIKPDLTRICCVHHHQQPAQEILWK